MAHRWGKIKKDDLNSEKSYSEVYCYCQSKLANILFTRELARHLKDTKVTVNALHPGVINTGIARHVGKITILFNKYLVRPIMYFFYKTPWQGAQTTIYAGSQRTSEFSYLFIIQFFFPPLALDPDLENVSGQYFA